MRRYPGAVGVGIGGIVPVEEGPQDPAAPLFRIGVFLKSEENLPARPQSVEGIEINFEVTGPFFALSGRMSARSAIARI
jgi:hypothetical protein